MVIARIRGVASLDLTGVRAIELLSDWSAPVLLRSLNEAGVDQGAVDLTQYAGGFAFEIWSAPGGERLVAGTAEMLGTAAQYTLTLSGLPTANDVVTVTYPDRSDTSAEISTQIRPYKFVVAPSAAYEVAIAATAPLSLANLASAINGDADYASANVGHGTLAASELVASAADSVLTITARDGGTWGNAVSVVDSPDDGSVMAVAQTVTGSGQSGLQLGLPGELLVATLVPAPDTTRTVHGEVYGLLSAGSPATDPEKLITCPAMLYASTMTLPT